VLLSGFKTDKAESRARSLGIRRVLLKPISIRALAENVRAVLDEGGAGTITE
jgi:hypothetical protein